MSEAAGFRPKVMPANAVDCHVHVFDPGRFPFSPDRLYTPAAATVADLDRFLSSLDVQRVVLVQPSVYGTDNRCMLDAIATLGADRARGIAVVDPRATSLAELADLHDQGIRGLRVNLAVHGAAGSGARDQVADAAALAESMPGWCLQIHASAAVCADALASGMGVRVPVVLDHYAGLREPACQPELVARLADLIATRDVHLKMSAPYKLHSPEGGRPAGTAAVARKFFAANPQRILWGSDWPHTGGGAARGNTTQIEPFRSIDDAGVVQTLAASASDTDWASMLVANPGRLFFAE